MAIKISIKKLQMDHSLEEVINACEKMEIRNIEISSNLAAHTLELKEWHHKDPFDRMLISIAQYYDLVLITKNKHIMNYTNLKTIW